jgi:signal transduction histidine kinase
MKTERGRRGAVVALALAAILLVGYVDGNTSAYVAFSIFYVVPIFLASWFGNRLTGVVAAVGSALCGLAADVLSIGARPIYAYANLASRLLLFLVVAEAFSRLRRAMNAERQLAENERRIRELQEQLMRDVVHDSREPLGVINAKIVDLGFDQSTLSPSDARELLSSLLAASAKVSRAIDTLETSSPSDPARETSTA